MGTEVKVLPATPELAEQLAGTMRPEDVAEVRAQGWEPLPALLQSMRGSDVSIAVVLGDQVGAMFGVGQLAGVSARVGQVWFLTGEVFARHPKAFVRVARQALAQLLELYPVLFNLIDTRYAAALRWARWLKFDIGAPLPFGPEGVLFAPAHLRRDAWAR